MGKIEGNRPSGIDTFPWCFVRDSQFRWRCYHDGGRIETDGSAHQTDSGSIRLRIWGLDEDTEGVCGKKRHISYQHCHAAFCVEDQELIRENPCGFLLKTVFARRNVLHSFGLFCVSQNDISFFDAFRQESICYRATIKLLVIGWYYIG